MRPNRRDILMLPALVGAILLCGCSGGMGNWWNRHKDKPASGSPGPSARNQGPVDQKLIDDVMRDDDAEATSQPSATSVPTSRPAGRKEWAKAKKQPIPTTSKGRRSTDKSIETPILFINGEVITVHEVLDPLNKPLEDATKEMSLPEYQRFALKKVKGQLLMLIDEVLAYGEAKKQIKDEMEPAIKKAVDQTEQGRINAEFQGRFSRYQAYLEAEGQDRQEIRRRIRRHLVVRQYLRDTFLPLVHAPTRRELAKYYEKHPDEFTEPLRVEMFLIDVPYWEFLEGGSSQDRQALWPKLRGPRRIEARRKATQHMDRARQELASGIPFDAVARSYSFGPNAKKGGAWGAVSPGALTGRWADAAEVLFQLKPDQVSDVVTTEEGLLLVKAGKRFEKRAIPFLEAQPIIEDKLVKERQRQLETDLLSRLRAKATINEQEVESFMLGLDKALPKHPDAEKKSYKLRSTIQ
ncbi:MAG: peptidylprolyl isomerase [Phycisphaerae bacterium]|nr:peptidylprolyl isomerase [Phycisphaerae bacterium]